jgi:hypothetical protein
MIRKIVAAAALAVASLAVAVPANALSPGDTVCYAADGSAVVNPSNPDDFEYCVTRESSGTSSGGGSTPVLCTADVYFYAYDDGLGSTGPYRPKSCTPIKPLQG